MSASRQVSRRRSPGVVARSEPRYTRWAVPIAIITFGFDPFFRLGPDVAVRWQTLALAAVIGLILAWSGVLARRTGLRADDLLSIAIGAVPGAVIAGRLAWIAVHPGLVPLDPWAWLDPRVGGFDLAAAVIGGVASGACIAALSGAPVGRWAYLLAVPVLLVLGGGKLTMLLGGSGQGLPADVPWATAYVGPGPWGSLAASVPAHPAQAYEGLATLAVAMALTLVARSGFGAAARADGAMLLVAVAVWAFVRAGVSLTWRDPITVGPFATTGWVAVAVGIFSIAAAIALVLLARRPRTGRQGAGNEPADPDDPEWPDPEARPSF